MQQFQDAVVEISAVEVALSILLIIVFGAYVFRNELLEGLRNLADQPDEPPKKVTHYVLTEDGEKRPIEGHELVFEDDVELGAGATVSVADASKVVGSDPYQFDFWEPRGTNVPTYH